MSAHPYDVLSLNNGANIIFTPCSGPADLSGLNLFNLGGI